jgi:quercetin dioxygenase-like cupin family protein
MRSEKPIEIVSKGWGYEKIIVNNEFYCGKLLHIIKHCRTSVHYHEMKQETFYVESGKAKVFYSDDMDKMREIADSEVDANKMLIFSPGSRYAMDTRVLNPGDKFEVPRRRVHCIMALEDTKLFEFSTTHEDSDSHRLIKGD